MKICSHILKNTNQKQIFYAVNKINTVVRKFHALFQCGKNEQGNPDLGISC